MKVLVDFHHHDLWESLELLCARLGWTLYRPIGMEWFDEGYWNFERAWHGDKVARQYLEPWGSDLWHPTENGEGYWTRLDPSHGRYYKMLKLDEARELRPDIVIASVSHNHEGLARFASEVGATFGLHLGNVRFAEMDMAEDRWDLAKFGIVTTLLPAPVPVPTVVVHQEFSLTDFRHEPPQPKDPFRVSSFVNCFAENLQGYGQFRVVADSNREFDWRVYGSYGSMPQDEYAAGNLGKCADVGQAMRDSDIAWHTKIWSDGFGHVIHDWFAVGRPVFGYQGYYASQLAGPLWVEGETSFNIEDKSEADVMAIIRRLRADPEYHARISDNAARRFREIVNFDEEEQAIRGLFSRVL